MDGLTQPQSKCLDFIRAFLEEKGFPPTSREIQAHFGFASQNAAVNHIKALERKGFISRYPGQPRTIKVLERA